MNKHPVVRRTVSLAASVLVSFAVAGLIANYAIPSDTPQLLVQAETPTATATATPAQAPRAAR